MKEMKHNGEHKNITYRLIAKYITLQYFCRDWLIYLKEWQRKDYGRSFTHSDSLLKWPQWRGLGQGEVQSPALLPRLPTCGQQGSKHPSQASCLARHTSTQLDQKWSRKDLNRYSRYGLLVSLHTVMPPSSPLAYTGRHGAACRLLHHLGPLTRNHFISSNISRRLSYSQI